MARAATDVMQSVIFSAVIEAMEALKTASKGLPNQMVRDIQAIHRNTTFADLPKELQDSIGASVRAAFTQLLKEGYSVAPRDAGPGRPQPRHAELVDRGARGPRPPRPQGRGPRPPGPRSPGGGRPPGGKPRSK